jgi:hypothetical protein
MVSPTDRAGTLEPSVAIRKERGGSDRAYIQELRANLSDLIDQLDLSDLRKRMLKSRWLDQVMWMEGRANQSRSWYYRLRLTAIIGGILVPITVTVSQASHLGWVAWLATGLGAVVAIASGAEEFFDYGERWRNYRQTVEMLKIEGWQFFQLSGPYSRRESHAQAYEKFAGRVEDIAQHDVQVYINQIVAEREEHKKGAIAEEGEHE